MAKTKTLIADSSIINTMPLVQAQPGNTRAGVALYSFYVINATTGRVEKSFGFDIPPQNISMDEAAAAEAVALQEGAYYTDERGQYFKNVTISGTFGFRPTPKLAGGEALNTVFDLDRSVNQVQNAVSNVLGQSVANQGFPQGEVTGWMRYRDLHNIIRFYWEMKTKRSTAADYVFVYANWKTGEVYIAQPLQFRRNRQAPGGRFKRNYDLNLKLLSPLDVSRPIADFLPKPNFNLSFWLGRVRAVVGVIDAASAFVQRSANSALDFAGELQDASITAREILGSINESVLNPIATLTNITRSVLNNTRKLSLMPADASRQLVRDCLVLKSVFENEAKNFSNITGEYRDVGNSYSKMARGLASLHIGMHVVQVKGTLNEDIRTYANAYRTQNDASAVNSFGERTSLQPSNDRGSGTGLRPGAPVGSRTAILPSLVGIKEYALTVLGSAGRWKEIAILNKLEAPYFSPKGDGVTVLRPGDPVKIPEVPDDPDESNQVFSTEDDISNRDAIRYGRDLRVDLEDRDLQVDDTGDLAVVDGLENLRQAMQLKVWAKPGDLKLHPWFGFGGQAGQGLSIDVLAGLHLQARSTLISDTRIEEVKNLNVRASGDIVSIRATMVPKEKDDSFDLTLRSRIG